MRRLVFSLLLLVLCIGVSLETAGRSSLDHSRGVEIPFSKDNGGEGDQSIHGDFQVKVEPTSRGGEPGSNVIYVVKVTPLEGAEGEVELSAEGLPPGVSEAFYPERLRLDLKLTFGLRSILILTVDPMVSLGSYEFLVEGTLEGVTRTAEATLHVVEERSGEEEKDFIVNVTPSTRSVNLAGETVRYTVEVKPVGGFHKKVSLTVTGLPEGSTAFFNPREGKVDPKLTSKLTILTSTASPPGVHELIVFGAYKDLVHYATASLVIQGGVTTTETTVQSVRRSLQITVSTDQTSYLVNETVRIYGYAQTFRGDSLPEASVSIQVLDPKGNTAHTVKTMSDGSGYYSESFTLKTSSPPGTYSIYVTVSHPKYLKGFSSTVFTVGKSSTPSITIESLYTTSVNGTIKNSFSPGETLIVWVSAVNGGAELSQGLIWVEVIDPNGVPVMVGILITTIREGRGIKSGLQVALNADATPGIYKANGFVSDGLISQGGRFLASKQIFFIVS